MPPEKLTVKSTDLLILRLPPDDPEDALYIKAGNASDAMWRTAQHLHEETGALVLIAPADAPVLECLSEEAARMLLRALQERFEEEQDG